MKEYCVLKKDGNLRKLQSLIKLYPECNNHDSLQELNLQHVLNRAITEESKQCKLRLRPWIMDNISYRC